MNALCWENRKIEMNAIIVIICFHSCTAMTHTHIHIAWLFCNNYVMWWWLAALIVCTKIFRFRSIGHLFIYYYILYWFWFSCGARDQFLLILLYIYSLTLLCYSSQFKAMWDKIMCRIRQLWVYYTYLTSMDYY